MSWGYHNRILKCEYKPGRSSGFVVPGLHGVGDGVVRCGDGVVRSGDGVVRSGDGVVRSQVCTRLSNRFWKSERLVAGPSIVIG